MTKGYELRSNQLVGSGGVGAIVDIGDESFIVCDSVEWGRPSHRIRLDRMESRLRRQLYRPPIDAPGSRGSVVLSRFPASLFCNHHACRRIVTRWNEHRHGNPGGKPCCPSCGKEGTLVPMRFVAACRHGHLSDVPWSRWVTHTPQCRSVDQLRLVVNAGGTGGLESLVVECVGCSARRDLSSITARGSMKKIGVTCQGRHPWLYDDTATCGQPLEVLQRGATNLYYPWSASALSLGSTADNSGSDALAALREAADFGLLVKMAAKYQTAGNHVHPLVQSMAESVAETHGLDAETVLSQLAIDGGGTADGPADGTTGDWNEAEILAEEWAFLTSLAAASYESPDLVCRESDVPRFKGQSPFSRVLLLHRLREVRAFLGFRRIEPGAEAVRPEAGRGFPAGVRPWLPAVEVFGEGIFIAFDEEWLSEWEAQITALPEERQRLLALEAVRTGENYWFLPVVTPRLVAIHTFAHLLMRQLVFESGYSSSALRERIYAGANAAGVLIYTADGDSEGSLGGLVRQGQPNRLGDTILLALDNAVWCSADPVCSETNGQGLGGFNRGACHACGLVPETSCTMANTLLDRGLLLGRPGVPGLLGDLV